MLDHQSQLQTSQGRTRKKKSRMRRAKETELLRWRYHNMLHTTTGCHEMDLFSFHLSEVIFCHFHHHDLYHYLEFHHHLTTFQCNICLDTARDAVVSMCGHLFCWPCLHQVVVKPYRFTRWSNHNAYQCSLLMIVQEMRC